MNLPEKSIAYQITLVSLVFLLSSSSAGADDCVQNRAIPQAPDKIYKQSNPLKPTPTNLSAGKMLYEKGAKPVTCIQCHGAEGKGDGKVGAGLKPPPRDFSCQAMMKNIPDGQLFWIIQNGAKGTGMMSFKSLSDDQIWQLVAYIRQFHN